MHFTQNKGRLYAFAHHIAFKRLGHGTITVPTDEVFNLPMAVLCLTSSSSFLQALCAVGFCGGRDLRDQGCKEEGESSAHY